MADLKRTIIYPGSFDPITRGHEDLVSRASKIFDEVIVAIAADSSKSASFSIRDRINMATEVLNIYPNVTVCSFNGLLINFVKEKQTNIILRGIRAVSDFEYEFQLAGMNRKLMPDMETVFLTPSEQYTYISSSLVKEVAKLGGNVSEFVAPIVASKIDELL